MLWIIIIGAGLVLVLIVIGIAVTARSENTLVEERLGRYLDEDQLQEKKAEKPKATPVGDWLNRALEGSSVGGGIARDLAQADLKVKPGEYIAARVIVAVGAGFIGWYINRGAGFMGWIVTLALIIVGFMLPKYWVNGQKKKRLIKFDDQLADMLNLMVNGLRAGYSNLQAMEAVSKEMPSPISDEFRRVVQEIQLGLVIEIALDNLIRRIPSPDLDLVVTAMNVQREVGGNLAEILDTISYTIRERVRIKGEIRVLTSQVMYSGRFLAMMPLIIAGILWVLNRDYMMQFFNPETRLAGIAVLIVAAIMVASGYFVMVRIATIEV
ncbi:MAG: type II secretion system F family protein [Chloroflexota bacterium]